MGSSKKTKTVDSTTTTTPNVPDFAYGPIQNYYADVANFGNGNMADYTTPANSIQSDAFGKAGLLGLGDDDYQRALWDTDAARQSVNNIRNISAQGAGIPLQYKTADVAGLGDRAVSTTNLPTLGSASTITAASLGSPTSTGYRGYTAQGYDASLIGNPGQFLSGNIERASSQSLLDNLPAYMNPYLSQVVDATLASYDDSTGRQRAALAAQAARGGAFGGSRYGIAQSQFEADSGRNRALTDAELRTNAFNTALNASNLDADRRQTTGIFNAGQRNARDLAIGEMGFQGAVANQGAINTSRQFTASEANKASEFGAGAYNTAQIRDANSADQFMRDNAGYLQEANIANQDAINDFAKTYFDARTQAALQDSRSQNDAYSQVYGENATNARQNAQAVNDARSQFYDTEAETRRFNTDQYNDVAKFNNQQELERAVQLLAAANQSAGIAGDRSQNVREDIGAQLGLGDRLWELQNQNSPLAQLIMQGSLLDPSILSIITGSTGQTNGKEVTKSSGGLLGSLGSLAALAANFIPGAGPFVSAGIGAATKMAEAKK